MKTRIGHHLGLAHDERDIMEVAPEGTRIGDSIRVGLGHVSDQSTLPLFHLDQ